MDYRSPTRMSYQLRNLILILVSFTHKRRPFDKVFIKEVLVRTKQQSSVNARVPIERGDV